MQVDIQARGFALTEALRSHCERRMRFAIGPGASRLQGVTVRMADENGPRGGVDKRCTVKAVMPGAPAIVIAQDDVDLYVAIDRAADRLSRTLSRRLARSWRGRRGASSKGDWQTADLRAL